MKAAIRHAAVALTGSLVAFGALTLFATFPAAGRPTAGACSSNADVTVVVDFGAAGGGVKTGCAAAPVNSGFEALVKAGFAIANVRSNPGFLCQIDGKPTSDCQAVPNASHYWSYWSAPRGGTWTYNTSGASRRPPAGSVEGWSFGATLPPGSAPPGPIVTTTTAHATPPSTDPRPTTDTTAPDSGTATTLAPSQATDTTSDVASDLDVTTSTRVPTSSGQPNDPAVEGETAAANPTADAGSPAGVLLAGALLAGVGTLGVGTARRRARNNERAG